MGTCLVVGGPNSGKTSLVLSLANLFGAELVIRTVTSAGKAVAWESSRARCELVSAHPHTTLEAQTIRVTVRTVKAWKEFDLVDTAGLVSYIHHDEAIRRAMAQTVALLSSADLVLHLVDAATLGSGLSEAVGPIDLELASYCHDHRSYLVVATKMDLATAPRGLARIRQLFPEGHIVPVSVVTGQGLKVVKSYIIRAL
ncbi:MAG: GTPase domain-containing protein [Bacillota bacterium]